MTANFILHAGTQIVLRVPAVASAAGVEHPAGAVAEIVHSPTDPLHAYRVRFADGTESSLRRAEFAVLKDVQRDGLAAASDIRGAASDVRRAATVGAAGALEEFNLADCVIFRCVVGSQAYGLAEDESDVDRRGIYLPAAEAHWSLGGVPEQLDMPETEECYWEIQKFLTLALKANPNVLECLYTPLIELATPLAQDLRAMRDAFLSRLIYQTYNGYVLSQFKKIDLRLRDGREIKWKHAMHLIRLLLSGITALREGVIPVAVHEHRDRLLLIRRGRLAWDEVNAWRLELHRLFDEAYAATKLPERPDYHRANALLLQARRLALAVPQGVSIALTHPAEVITEREPNGLPAAVCEAARAHRYPLVFATISGAHLYGFPSPDSDYDLRGAHVLPLHHVLGLKVRDETVEGSSIQSGMEIDLVTHDVHKFFTLMLKRNGYVLEQVFSPLVVHTTPEHDELKAIARKCVTRHHVHHYLGFARTQWRLLEKERSVKALLYVYRVLLTGIHLMRTGEVEANLRRLDEAARLPAVEELIARKTQGAERATMDDADLPFHLGEYDRLTSELRQASESSRLPDAPRGRDALNDLLIRIRRSVN